MVTRLVNATRETFNYELEYILKLTYHKKDDAAANAELVHQMTTKDSRPISRAMAPMETPLFDLTSN